MTASAVAHPAEVALSDIRLSWKRGRAALLDHFGQHPQQVTPLLHGLTRLADQTLQTLWTTSGMPPDAALIAVGGYGRGELFPFSDIDLLLLLEQTQGSNAAIDAAASGFITACWDIGLEIGPSVRTIEACIDEADKDITVQTALLESRFLCGNRALADSLNRAFFAHLDARAFFQAKMREQQQRHLKFEDTPYALEPNCKESPGGLRDLQVVLWVAQASGLGRSWKELAAHGIIHVNTVRQIQRNETVIKRIRAHLHVLAGRREDRLVFDQQSAVAKVLGFAPTPTKRAGERLMQRYYWAAKAVEQINQIVLLDIEGRLWPQSVAVAQPVVGLKDVEDGRYVLRDGMIEPAHLQLFEQEPWTLLEIFAVFQRAPGARGLSPAALRAIYLARHRMDSAFRHDPRSRAQFVRILQAPQGIVHALRLMNRTSVLGRYLWAFRRIVGQMQHDLFHVYTVDQHILMVVRNVRRFFMPEHAHEYPLCSELAAHFDPPWVLILAALFHDIAKGRGGDHSELGAVETRKFCKAHGISAEHTELAVFLVREHLQMSRVAQKEDLSDPEVIAAFARRVGDERHLVALYLLTVADIRGTSPKVWNAWKGKLLENLYRATLRALGGQTPQPEAELQLRQREAQRILNLYALPQGAQKPLWDTLDMGYFLRNDPQDIAWHTRKLYARVASPSPVISARLAPEGEGLEVLVYAPDQPDLFARICGYFDHQNFNILDAKIHTANNGWALDSFVVVSPHTKVHDRAMTGVIETSLLAELGRAAPLPPPHHGRLSRRVRNFPVSPRVGLRPDERGQRWILNVTAHDRAGLLFGIAQVLAKHHIDLQLAKITTLGERVEDTFLVSGPGLGDARIQNTLENELLQAIMD
ncbi:MAG: [protein-PII] uridylyltransferase [Thiomonas arsenitoxydans]|uniref:Bifunctional uridylyltransferase/uridylyl-removing enzyme n=1 Tax=Thiomonas arsenitoxydans (strain DSM 22701 / CIP 110005 / 3As) TaxID=426114 RepID=A0A8I1SWE2_THIA3|nr:MULTISPECIES: [protein-PII] uridylyltransferase [Thiomonas]MBN8743496.1 [protein-PII] uridylyltransferase [Thiomonas arsenitoxydans]ODU96915.1 MAG: [protein-PII] uridylyltransferase [Thiomonas sp. SCN 64-16]